MPRRSRKIVREIVLIQDTECDGIQTDQSYNESREKRTAEGIVYGALATVEQLESKPAMSIWNKQ